jgi:hypothetical protein
MALVSVHTKLAKAIEKRIMSTFQREDRPLSWSELLVAAKVERWAEYTKHVWGWMVTRKLVRNIHPNICDVERTGYQYDDYERHLHVLKYNAEAELRGVKELLKQFPKK